MTEQIQKSQFHIQNKSQINLNRSREDFADKSQLIVEENMKLVENLNEYPETDNRAFSSQITRTTQLRKLKKPTQQSQFKHVTKKQIRGDVERMYKRPSIDVLKQEQLYDQTDENDVRAILDSINFDKKPQNKSAFQMRQKKQMRNEKIVLMKTNVFEIEEHGEEHREEEDAKQNTLPKTEEKHRENEENMRYCQEVKSDPSEDLSVPPSKSPVVVYNQFKDNAIKEAKPEAKDGVVQHLKFIEQPTENDFHEKGEEVIVHQRHVFTQEKHENYEIVVSEEKHVERKEVKENLEYVRKTQQASQFHHSKKQVKNEVKILTRNKNTLDVQYNISQVTEQESCASYRSENESGEVLPEPAEDLEQFPSHSPIVVVNGLKDDSTLKAREEPKDSSIKPFKKISDHLELLKNENVDEVVDNRKKISIVRKYEHHEEIVIEEKKEEIAPVQEDEAQFEKSFQSQRHFRKNKKKVLNNKKVLTKNSVQEIFQQKVIQMSDEESHVSVVDDKPKEVKPEPSEEMLKSSSQRSISLHHQFKEHPLKEVEVEPKDEPIKTLKVRDFSLQPQKEKTVEEKKVVDEVIQEVVDDRKRISINQNYEHNEVLVKHETLQQRDDINQSEVNADKKFLQQSHFRKNKKRVLNNQKVLEREKTPEEEKKGVSPKFEQVAILNDEMKDCKQVKPDYSYDSQSDPSDSPKVNPDQPQQTPIAKANQEQKDQPSKELKIIEIPRERISIPQKYEIIEEIVKEEQIKQKEEKFSVKKYIQKRTDLAFLHLSLDPIEEKRNKVSIVPEYHYIEVKTETEKIEQKNEKFDVKRYIQKRIEKAHLKNLLNLEADDFVLESHTNFEYKHTFLQSSSKEILQASQEINEEVKQAKVLPKVVEPKKVSITQKYERIEELTETVQMEKKEEKFNIRHYIKKTVQKAFVRKSLKTINPHKPTDLEEVDDRQRVQIKFVHPLSYDEFTMVEKLDQKKEVFNVKKYIKKVAQRATLLKSLDPLTYEEKTQVEQIEKEKKRVPNPIKNVEEVDNREIVQIKFVHPLSYDEFTMVEKLVKKKEIFNVNEYIKKTATKATLLKSLDPVEVEKITKVEEVDNREIVQIKFVHPLSYDEFTMVEKLVKKKEIFNVNEYIKKTATKATLLKSLDPVEMEKHELHIEEEDNRQRLSIQKAYQKVEFQQVEHTFQKKKETFDVKKYIKARIHKAIVRKSLNIVKLQKQDEYREELIEKKVERKVVQIQRNYMAFQEQHCEEERFESQEELETKQFAYELLVKEQNLKQLDYDRLADSYIKRTAQPELKSKQLAYELLVKEQNLKQLDYDRLADSYIKRTAQPEMVFIPEEKEVRNKAMTFAPIPKQIQKVESVIENREKAITFAPKPLASNNSENALEEYQKLIKEDHDELEEENFFDLDPTHLNQENLFMTSNPSMQDEYFNFHTEENVQALDHPNEIEVQKKEKPVPVSIKEEIFEEKFLMVPDIIAAPLDSKQFLATHKNNMPLVNKTDKLPLKSFEKFDKKEFDKQVEEVKESKKVFQDSFVSQPTLPTEKLKVLLPLLQLKTETSTLDPIQRPNLPFFRIKKELFQRTGDVLIPMNVQILAPLQNIEPLSECKNQIPKIDIPIKEQSANTLSSLNPNEIIKQMNGLINDGESNHIFTLKPSQTAETLSKFNRLIHKDFNGLPDVSKTYINPKFSKLNRDLFIIQKKERNQQLVSYPLKPLKPIATLLPTQYNNAHQDQQSPLNLVQPIDRKLFFTEKKQDDEIQSCSPMQPLENTFALEELKKQLAMQKLKNPLPRDQRWTRPFRPPIKSDFMKDTDQRKVRPVLMSSKMKPLPIDFFIKPNQFSESKNEPQESSLNPSSKPENLKFPPLDSLTINSNPNHPLSKIENILNGLSSGKVPNRDPLDRPLMRMRLPYIPKTNVFNPEEEKMKMALPQKQLQSFDQNQILFDHHKIPQTNDVIFLKNKLLELQKQVQKKEEEKQKQPFKLPGLGLTFESKVLPQAKKIHPCPYCLAHNQICKNKLYNPICKNKLHNPPTNNTNPRQDRLVPSNLIKQMVAQNNRLTYGIRTDFKYLNNTKQDINAEVQTQSLSKVEVGEKTSVAQNK